MEQLMAFVPFAPGRGFVLYSATVTIRVTVVAIVNVNVKQY
jgi:hypothetical protein